MGRLTRTDSARSHSYLLDGEKVPGVTTVIGTLDKPALVGWAARETAAYADEHWAELSELRSADRLERLVKARFQKNRRAVATGNRVHALGERISHGEAIPWSEIEPGLRPWVEGYAAMLDAWDMEVLHSELPVCHTEFGYAGTLDAIVISPRLGTVLLDIKTGGGVYDEVGLQLAAYRYADLGAVATPQTGPRGGKMKPIWGDIDLPHIDTCVVAHVREDGTTLHEITADKQIWVVFLHLLQVYESWVQRTSSGSRDSPDSLQIISPPLYTEDHPIIASPEEAAS